MEDTFNVATNGTQIQVADLQQIAQTAALADDRVFAELFRLAPYNGAVSKAITNWNFVNDRDGILSPGAPASGLVTIRPFRALIGSQVAEASNPKENVRGVRSGIHIGTSTTLAQSVSLVNAAGSPVIALVYATVTLNAASPTVVRKIKDVTNLNVATSNVVVTLHNQVDVAVAYGTPAVTPLYPSLPADTPGVSYNVPVAYIWLPAAFNSTSTLTDKQIQDISPVVHPSAQVGASSLRIARQNYDPSLFAAGTRAAGWSNTGVRTNAFMPRSMAGSESILLALDLVGAAAGWSIVNDQIIDDTCDWKNRVFRISAAAVGAAGVFPWEVNSNNTAATTAPNIDGLGNYQAFSHSMTSDAALAGGAGVIVYLTPTQLSAMAGASFAYVYVDASGAMRAAASIAPGPNCKLFLWIEGSGQMLNRPV